MNTEYINALYNALNSSSVVFGFGLGLLFWWLVLKD